MKLINLQENKSASQRNSNKLQNLNKQQDYNNFKDESIQCEGLFFFLFI